MKTEKIGFKKKVFIFIMKLSAIVFSIFLFFYIMDKADKKGTLPLKGKILYYGIKLIILISFLTIFYFMLRDLPKVIK